MKLKNLKKRVVAVATAATLLASYTLPVANIPFASASTNPNETTYDLTIMHNNDTHAHLDNIAKTVTAVKQVREQYSDALLLHAGDVFSGTLYFNEFKGKADLEFMNMMKYDVMTFGNHEFDLGSSPEGHKALADFIKGAQFPFVSSNVDFSGDDKLSALFKDEISEQPEKGKIYNGIVKEVNGEKVGIFGLTTEETAGISSPDKVTFENYLEEAEKAVQAFEEQGINRIVAVTHIGYNDSAQVDNDLQLAAHVDGIDVIVGGHSHTELKQPVIVKKDDEGNDKDPTVIVQTGEYNNNLGLLNVNFDENGVVTEVDGKLLDVSTFAEDSEAAAKLKVYADTVAAIKNEEIGVEIQHPLKNPRVSHEGNWSGESVRNSETILGNLITDGMLYAANEWAKDNGKNVIMAVQNGGGIREAIDAGPITVGEVITVLPFGNTLSVMDLTGAEIKKAFEHSLRAYPDESGGFLHVAGAKVEFDSTKDVGERVVNISYKAEDSTYVALENDKMYTIATNYFTAKGGDQYAVFENAFEEGRVTDLGQSDWENFRDHLVRLGTDNIPFTTEGRIVDVNTFELSIMHNNDTHANLDNKNDKGVGPSVARTVTAVEKVRSVKPNALLLHAGDVFTGTLYFNKYLGQADLEFMNMMGYDAMTFGNHEFDLGSSEEGHQALADFIKGAEFPFVSSNVNFSGDEILSGFFVNEIVSDIENGKIYNGIIKEIDGEKVGIFGLTTEDTKAISSPDKVEFENYLEKAEATVAAFEKQGINKIVALTHIGFNDNANIDNDLELAKHVSGIDIIVGGHSHTELKEPVVVDEDGDGEPTVIVQTGEYNKNLGLLNVLFDENGIVTKADGKLLDVASFDENPEAAEKLAEYTKEIEKIQKEPIGVELKEALENPRTPKDDPTAVSVRNSETILGNLITDGMLYAAKKHDKNVIMAVQNGGGIRAPIDAGPITVGEVITVLPFGNTLSLMDVTGAELKAAFEHSFNSYPKEFGGFLHVAGGKVEFDSTKPVGERVVRISYKDEDGNYVEIKDVEMYTIATNYFTAKGGDGYDMFKVAFEDNRVNDLGQSDWENFRDHLKRVGSENIPTEIEGRIVDISKEEPTPGDEGNPGEQSKDPEIPGNEDEDEQLGDGNDTPGNNEQPGKGNDKPRNNEQSGKDNEQLGKNEQPKETKTVEVKKVGNKYIVTVNQEDLQNTNIVFAFPKEADSVVIPKEVIDALNENASVVYTKEVVDVKVPAAVLKAADGDVTVSVENVKFEEDSALVVYDFTISTGDKKITKFDKPITLTFEVDPSKVKNPEHVRVYYYNEAKDKWELVGGEYNPVTGKISVETNHFSIFGVFEVASADQAPKGKPLPNTATITFNTMAAGTILIVLAGGILFFINRRKNA